MPTFARNPSHMPPGQRWLFVGQAEKKAKETAAGGRSGKTEEESATLKCFSIDLFIFRKFRFHTLFFTSIFNTKR